ncbi:MAG: thymidine kinase [Candidatus Eisenbacteria bacterium]
MDMIPSRPGWIEVIAGCMFSGKSEELIRRLRRAQIAKMKVQAFKPAIDTRWEGHRSGEIISHDARRIPSFTVTAVEDIEQVLERDTVVVGIDEAQFFDSSLVGFTQALAAEGRRVVLAGLDLDYRGRPFEPMPTLMAMADFVTKVHAICMVCGGPATRSQRLVHSEERVLIGDEKIYEPRCRHCFAPHEAGAPAP